MHLFSRFASFKAALSDISFYAVIYSLSDEREERRNCLACLRDLTFTHSDVQRIVLASDEMEARLVSHLSPSRLHGIISKSVPLKQLMEGLKTLLSETHQVNDNMYNHWCVSQNRMLSPTERAILRYMSSGFSIPEIAAQLERNIKTIRAHKFNAMVKLGVNSDVGLLDAADILGASPCPGSSSFRSHRSFILLALNDAPECFWRIVQMHTSTHFAAVSSAILSGDIRTALWMAPAAGNTSAYCF